jgi:hypothetical protein
MQAIITKPAPFPLSEEAKAGTVHAIRDKMTFVEEWATVDNKPPITVRMYRTNGGTHGQQYRAIAWMHCQGGNVGCWVGAKTSGCGYCKANAAVADLLLAMGYPHDLEGREPAGQLNAAFPGRRWHHAHG